MKNLTIIASCVAALSFSTAVQAGSYTKASSGTKVLSVMPNLCPGTISALKTWASKTGTIGAFAVPSALPNSGLTCDNPGAPVAAGQAFNAPTVADAQAAALATCEQSRTENYGPCVVLGTVTTR